MKIINNCSYSIMVNDIGIIIPTTKMGSISIDDKRAAQSDELLSLISSKKISVFVEHQFIPINKNSSNMYIVPGYTVWDGNGKTKPTKSEFHSENHLPGEDTCNALLSMREAPTTYTIRKKCSSNLSIESIGTVLTRINPTRSITKDQLNNKDIQLSIMNGLVELISPDFKGGDKTKNVEDFKSTIIDDSESKCHSLSCLWEGPIFDSGGYANMNREYILNLSNLGVKVVPSLVETSNDIEPELIKRIVALNHKNCHYVSKKSPKVFGTNVPFKYSGTSISYTMMETEKRIHPDLVKMLSVANEIWVPSDWNRKIFINSGVKQPVEVMPLGVDPKCYIPRSPQVSYSTPIKKFVFYSCSTWLWRKGFDVLLKAYAKAFSFDDDVSLVIFTKVPGLPLGEMENKIRKDINNEVELKPSLPHLVVLNSFVPTFIMPYLYNSADCFVLFSRGEGWGLPYCEAAASGIPVIGADHGGQKMFLSNKNSFLIRPDKISPCHQSLLYMTPFYKNMMFADYSDKAISRAVDCMRQVYEDRIEANNRADLCRKDVLDNFTWEKSAKRVYNRLKVLQA